MNFSALFGDWGNSYYSSAADIATVAISLMNWMLITTTYTKKQQNLRLFHLANGMVTISVIFSMSYHWLLNEERANIQLAYIMHSMMYVILAIVFLCYFIYIKNLIDMTKRHEEILYVLIFVPFIIFLILKITGPWTGIGHYVMYYSELKNWKQFVYEPFRYLYLYDCIIMAVILYIYRKKFITKMLHCIVESVLMAWALIILQIVLKQSSFTCLTFIFPIEAVLFLYHYSSYDIDTGTLDNQAFEAYIKDLYGKKLTFVTLTLEKFDSNNMSKELSFLFYHFNEKYFNDSIIFKVRSNILIMILQNDKNPDVQQKIEEMLQDFRESYNKYLLDFKVVIMQSDPRFVVGKQYIRLDDYLKKGMELNTVKYCKEDDLNKFLKNMEIIEALRDINQSKNLDDPRVKVFCQPILDTNTKRYSTAEALMRIELPNIGMIYPDTFIPMLENFELIHDFTLIMLNKTCKQIAEFMKEGYQIDRITINISMQELKNKYLCKEFTDIIEKNNIPYSKIGIELTESLNELDYENTKYAINEWKKYGMSIYLDDFGTGYSNISRILQLPFDVIKFDRSLTIESGGSDQSRFIVDNFAKIFKRAKYHVLFEGVETIYDEERCMKMGADMLQGYSYSKPIPIENIKSFLDTK